MPCHEGCDDPIVCGHGYERSIEMGICAAWDWDWGMSRRRRRRDGDRAGGCRARRCRRSGSSGRGRGGRRNRRRRRRSGGGGSVEGCPAAGGGVVFGALGEVFAGYGWYEGVFCVAREGASGEDW